MSTPSGLPHIFAVASRLTRKRLFRVFGRLNKKLQPIARFGIKPGYHHSGRAASFNDTANKDEWQREVYEYALQCMRNESFRSVIDVGCGSAYKLVNMFGGYNTTGIEVEPTFTWLKTNYPEKNWLLFNDVRPETLQADLVICSDVIEHVANPDELLQFLQRIDARCYVLSTPERDAVAGKNDYGPPENTAHYREWNAQEFRNYASQWFNITDQRIFSSKSTTQLLNCKKY
jgi:SAM-dependent methyltransferase